MEASRPRATPPAQPTVPPLPWSITLPPLGALRTAPGTARGHVRNLLKQWHLGDLADTAEEVTGELVANAVNASTDRESGAPLYRDGRLLTVILCLRTDRSRVRVETWDEAPGVPALRVAGAWDVSGRGLAMVDVLSEHRWGWHPASTAPWKCVWADLGPAHSS